MKIAVPYDNGEIVDNFESAERIKVYEFDEMEKVTDVEIFDLNENTVYDVFFKEKSINMLICYKISNNLKETLTETGVDVFTNVVGGADSAVIAYYKKELPRSL